MKKLRVVLIIAFLFMGTLFFVLFSDATFTRKPDGNLDFSRVIRDYVALESRVVDIAMLGAHNAFTDNISSRGEIAAGNTNAFVSPLVNTLAPGLVARLMACQKSDASGLLQRGVRYFDVRLVFHEGEWFTHHTLLSSPLRDYLLQIVEFLHYNAGELVVFDIQHVRLEGRQFADLWAYIAQVTYRGRSLLDFVVYDTRAVALGDLTLGCATLAGASAGLVILAKTPVTEGGWHYFYDSSIRSQWHNRIRTREMVEAIQGESLYLAENASRYANRFRVNQAQTTPNFDSVGNALYSLGTWSVISHNARHNARLVAREDFTEWLEVMPIFMVDFSDTRRGGFNARVMGVINGFNSRE